MTYAPLLVLVHALSTVFALRPQQWLLVFHSVIASQGPIVMDVLRENSSSFCIQIIPCKVDLFDGSVGLEHAGNGSDEVWALITRALAITM